MSSSLLNWRSIVPVFILVLAACTDQPSKDWPRFEGLDAGGYTVSMPVKADFQHGRLTLGPDTVDTHVDIIADSAVIYVAAWFKTPTHLTALPEPAFSDSLWSMVVAPLSSGQEELSGPDLNVEGASGSGWFLNNKGTRVGLVLHRMADRVVVLTATAPEGAIGDPERRNMERFLHSFEPLH
jgi:hypothetical protein